MYWFFQLSSFVILLSWFLFRKISPPQGYTHSVAEFFPKIYFLVHMEITFDYGMKQRMNVIFFFFGVTISLA